MTDEQLEQLRAVAEIAVLNRDGQPDAAALMMGRYHKLVEDPQTILDLLKRLDEAEDCLGYLDSVGMERDLLT